MLGAWNRIAPFIGKNGNQLENFRGAKQLILFYISLCRIPLYITNMY